MSKVIIQPAAGIDAQIHFKDTIEQAIPLSRIQKFVSPENFKNLKLIYPNNECLIWGATPPGKTKWDKIERGDVVLFTGQKKAFASAVVTYKIHNKELSINLWGHKKNKSQPAEEWEYVYFLEEKKIINISYDELNDAIPYSRKNNFQQWLVLDNSQSNNVFQKFDLESDVFIEETTDDGYKEVLTQLEGLKESDTQISGLTRKEQGYLRKILFGKKTIDVCACCNRELPVSLLITAHIKKRAFCSLDEKLNKNIVIPMCKLGCDEIYEKGYISVKEGKFIALNKTPTTPHLVDYIKNVNGNICKYYNGDTISFFKWHLKHHS